MRQVGKVGLQWQRTRRKWLKDNPPSHEGYYNCIICGGPVAADEVTIDHILPRSTRPDLRDEPTNLGPAHWKCNSLKGSKH